MLPYEQKLTSQPDWAMEEGDRYFSGNSEVFKALRRIARRLDELGIPYALVGALALFRHGYRRFTEDVDLLVTPEGLEQIHRRLDGRGYVAPFKGSRNLRDATSNVRIEFLVSGQYPGDGKPKSVVFPDPANEAIVVGELKVLNLPKLIELKLASGMSNERRLRDIVDVQELIEVLKLPKALAEKLDASVRPKFLDLYRIVKEVPDPYAEE